MRVTVEQLSRIGGKAASDNMNSVTSGLNVYGRRAGLTVPHRLAHYLAQLCVETAAFKYDRELASGEAYESRTDLGNTAAKDGDGPKYKGRSAIQVTGKANYTEFRDWCKAKGLAPPDFVDRPDLINTDPWEGLAPLWYWVTRKLNAYADKNDIEMIRRRVNGGLNGFEECLRYYTRVGLVLLGRSPDGVRGFQAWAQAQGYLPPGSGQVDGIAGPKTRAAIHMALVALNDQQLAKDEKPAPAPVVEEKAVVPEGSDKRTWLYSGTLTAMAGTVWSSFVAGDWQTRIVIGGITLAVLAGLLFFGERLIRRARKLIAEISGD